MVKTNKKRKQIREEARKLEQKEEAKFWKIFENNLPLNISFLMGIIILSIQLRTYTLKYGRLLGFDAYYFLREAGYYLKGGLPAIDPMAPTVARDFVKLDVQGLPIFTSTVAQITGLELMQVHMLVPIGLSAITVLFCFLYLRKLTGNLYASSLGALFVGIIPGFIYRTSGGFMEKDTIGAPMMMGAFLLMSYILEEKKSKLLAIEGVVLGILMVAYQNSFGNFLFVPIMFGMFLALLPLVEKEKKALIERVKDWNILALVIPMTVSLLIGFTTPAYLEESSDMVRLGIGLIAIVGGYLAYCIMGIVQSKKIYVGILSTFGVLGLVAIAVIFDYNLIALLISKMTERLASASGISGQGQITTWKQMYDKFHILFFVALGGAVYSAIELIRKENTKANLLLLSSYCFMMFASYYMIRNTFYGAIFVGIMSAYLFVGINKGVQKISSKGVALLVCALVLVPTMAYTTSNSVDYSKSTTIHLTTDWKNTLDWLKSNTPNDEVICNWWDFGYWVQTMAERKTISDGMRRGQSFWITGYSRFLNSNATESKVVLKEMEDEAQKTTGNEFKLRYILVDDSLLVKTSVLNQVGNSSFSFPNLQYMQTIEDGDQVTYIYGNDTMILKLTQKNDMFVCYLESGNTKYGVKEFIVENTKGKNWVINNIDYKTVPVTDIPVYFTTEGRAFFIKTPVDSMFVKMLVYENAEGYDLVYDNGTAKIFKLKE